MTPLISGLLGSLAGNYLMNKDDEEGTIWDKLGFNAQTPKTMTDPMMQVGGQPHVNITPQPIAPIAPNANPSQGSGFTGLFDDPERMARMTIALNSMRLNPDDNIAKSMENKLEAIRQDKMGNKSVATLRKMAENPNITETEKARLISLADLVANGGMLGTDALKEAFKRESGGVNINMGEGEYHKVIMKDVANMQSTHRERGELARSSLNALNELNTAITNFGETGPDAETKQKIRVLASKYGLGHLIDENKMSDGQYVEAIKNRMVAEELRQNKGPQTDFDAKFAGTYIPGLGTSTEANKALMNYSKSISLQQTIFSTMSADIRISDAKAAIATIREIDQLALMTPGAMEKNDGTWMTFNEFFNSKITLNLDGKEVNMSDLSAIERLKLWSNQYKKRMGFK
jgi:hypothetical protein